MTTPFVFDRVEGAQMDKLVFTNPVWMGEWRLLWFFATRRFKMLHYHRLPTDIVVTVSPCPVTDDMLIEAIPDTVMADLIARSHRNHWIAP